MSISQTKQRLFLTYVGTATVKSAPALPPSTVSFRQSLIQRTTSSGNQFRLLGKTTLDIGSGFTTQIAQCTSVPFQLNIVQIDKSTGNVSRSYSGPLWAYASNWSGKSTDLVPASTEGQLNALGTIGISRSLPTNPLAGMGQFLGELRQLPSMVNISRFDIWKAKTRDFRHIARRGAGEYLNFQFGWVPFVKDISNFFKVAGKADKHIEKYVQESGRNLHRGAKVYSSVETTVEDLGTAYPSPSLNGYISPFKGKLTREIKTTRKAWFRGCFTYYLPPVDRPGGELKRKMALARKLYGLTIDPDLLWKLTPWSWALDWVGNTGSVIRNWTAFSQDGLVMRYGYIMETITRDVTYTLTDLKWPQDDAAYKYVHNGPVALTQTFRSETKTRRKATPYGFGLNPNSFSARQWSIIAALGISKKPRSL